MPAQKRWSNSTLLVGVGARLKHCLNSHRNWPAAALSCVLLMPADALSHRGPLGHLIFLVPIPVHLRLSGFHLCHLRFNYAPLSQRPRHHQLRDPFVIQAQDLFAHVLRVLAEQRGRGADAARGLREDEGRAVVRGEAGSGCSM